MPWAWFLVLMDESNLTSNSKSSFSANCMMRGALRPLVQISWADPAGTANSACVPFIVSVASPPGLMNVHNCVFSPQPLKSSETGVAILGLMKTALTARSPNIWIVVGLVVPEASPCQPPKVEPPLGVAVSTTSSPKR